jgi:mono/diheme cytochrome c family protein
VILLTLMLRGLPGLPARAESFVDGSGNEAARVRLEAALAGPLAGVERVVFTVRTVIGEHWYANIGYSWKGPSDRLYGYGGRLCILELRTGRLSVILEDPAGAVRDPILDYDGKRILFSYRKGGTANFLLYTINLDGTGLRQLTADAGYDDYEPCWLPDGNILFVTTRARRWVPCWITQVGNIWRCDADGKNLRPLSANVEHDNTPWVLPDGRILYTRWEYINRSQLQFHHLWTMNPDGTGQMVWYGNMHPYGVYLDAKPIPGTDEVLFTYDKIHGGGDHKGHLAAVSNRNGPDDQKAMRVFTPNVREYRDPWPLLASLFMACRGRNLVLVDEQGTETVLFTLPDVFRGELSEARPVASRSREPVIPARVDLTQSVGRYLAQNVHIGRNMEGVKPGEIKRLMILEVLPKPINYTGGQEPLSYGGTFSLERILGTVPVEVDGSVHFEAPALRPLLFVALDEHNRAVKRMQSFTTVQPGEIVSCIGCHEDRNRAGARPSSASIPLAAQRAPSRIESIPDAPEVFDFPRHIQPILDQHCVSCHGSTVRDGGISLSSDQGPVYAHAYYTLAAWRLIEDGRNGVGNMPPRSFGSGGSKLMKQIDGSHHNAVLSEQEKRHIRLWLDAGAPYAGTYGALGSECIGGYLGNVGCTHHRTNDDKDWPATVAAQGAFDRRCASCHSAGKNPIPRSLSDEIEIPYNNGHTWFNPDNPLLRRTRHAVFNLTDPARSLYLLAPLAKDAGGLGTCTGTKVPAVLSGTDDPDYQLLLAMITAGKQKLDAEKRFYMPGYRPPEPYLREMKRYGVLPATFDPAKDSADPYELDLRYFELFQWRPEHP